MAELLAEHPGTGDGGRCEFAGASGVDGPSADDRHDEAAHYTWRTAVAQLRRAVHSAGSGCSGAWSSSRA
ncbi:hypothetical protein, partial [Xanthomonas sp. SHU 199]|uniref:hypothetical protein n=1 Tax=Xanthomonas sp. SHU 199 TaxID=1591174 RepID=UPI001E573A45